MIIPFFTPKFSPFLYYYKRENNRTFLFISGLKAAPILQAFSIYNVLALFRGLAGIIVYHKKNIIPVAFLLFFAGCSQKPNGDEFLISGHLDNAANQEMVILQEISPDGVVAVDTSTVDEKGEFNFLRKMPYQSLYVVQLGSGEYITLLPDYKEQININGDSKSFSGTYTIEGSPGSGQLWQLNKKNLEGISVVASLARTWEKAKAENADLGKVKDSLDQIFNKTLADQRQYILDFIGKNPGSLATLVCIYKNFSNRELLSPYEDLPVYEKVAENLEKNLPNNPHTIKFAEHVKRMKDQITQNMANKAKNP